MSSFSMMLERPVIRQPYFKVLLNNQVIPMNQHDKIKEISIEDFDDKLDAARLTIIDSDDYFFINNKDLVKDAPITIDMGHVDSHRIMFIGKISLVEADFKKDGQVNMMITAVDSGVTMSKGKKTRKWEKISKSDVVKKVVVENGWNCKVEDTKVKFPQITQNDETDLVFINRLAAEVNFKFYTVNEGNYVFGPINMKDPPVATLNYRQADCSIIDFSFNYASQDEAAPQNSDIDATSGKKEQNTGKAPDTKPKSNVVSGTTVGKVKGEEEYLGNAKDSFINSRLGR